MLDLKVAVGIGLILEGPPTSDAHEAAVICGEKGGGKGWTL